MKLDKRKIGHKKRGSQPKRTSKRRGFLPKSSKFIAVALFLLLCGALMVYSTVTITDTNVNIDGTDLWKSADCVVDVNGKGDYTTLQGCISELSNGGSIFVASGTYSISDTINLTDNTLISGSGYNTTIRQTDNSDLSFLIRNEGEPTQAYSKNIILRNLHIDCNIDGQDHSGAGAGDFKSAGAKLFVDDSEFNTLWFSNCGMYGGMILYGERNKLSNLVITNTTTLAGDSGTGYAAGLFITSTSAQNNDVDSIFCKDIAGHCVFLEDNTQGNTITNIQAVNAQSAVELIDTNYTSISSVVANVSTDGIYIGGNSHYNTLNGLIVRSATTGIKEATDADHNTYFGNDVTAATTKLTIVGSNSIYSLNNGHQFHYFDSGIVSGITELNATEINQNGNNVVDDSTGVVNLQDGLVLYMTLNSDGTAEDYAKLNDGSITSATFVTTGYYAGAYNFDGLNDLISISDDPTLKDIKYVSFWFKPDTTLDSSLGANQGLLFKRTSGGDYDGLHVMIDQVTGKLSCRNRYASGTDEQADSTSTSWTADTWYNVVCGYNGTDLVLYVDADLKTGTSTSRVQFNSTSADVRLGVAEGGYQWFNGTMDEVILWNTTISNNQVTAIHEQRTNLNPFMRIS